MGKQILGIILFKVVTTDISSRYLIPYFDGDQKETDYQQKKCGVGTWFCPSIVDWMEADMNLTFRSASIQSNGSELKQIK